MSIDSNRKRHEQAIAKSDHVGGMVRVEVAHG